MGRLVMGYLVMGCLVMGRLVMGRFVCESKKEHYVCGTVDTVLNFQNVKHIFGRKFVSSMCTHVSKCKEC